MTGSRTAGVLARIPIEVSVRSYEDVILQHGMPLGDRFFGVGIFVDNAFFVSRSLGGSLMMSSAVERRLRADWFLHVKAGSRMAMPVAGAPEITDLASFTEAWPDWRFGSTFRCLGMLLSK